MDQDRVRLLRRAAPQRDAGVGAVLAQDEVDHVDELELVHVVVVVARDALEGIHARFEGRHAAPHVLDDGVRSGNLDVLFPAAGRARGAHVLIGVAAGADNRRIAAASGEFEGEAAGGGASGDLTLVVERGTMNGAGRWRQDAPDGGHAKFRFDAQLGGAFFQALDALFPKFGLRWCG